VCVGIQNLVMSRQITRSRLGLNLNGVVPERSPPSWMRIGVPPILNSRLKRKKSSTDRRPVTPPSLCGMEGWEVDSNDPDLFPDEQEIHMAEVLGDDGAVNQGLKSMPRIHVPIDRVRTTPKMTLTLQGPWHSPPRLEVQYPSSNPPPLLKPPIQVPGVIVPGRNTPYTSIPRPERQPFPHSPKSQQGIHRLLLRESVQHQNHIEQVGPADKWAGGGQTFRIGDEY
jgi:hypothetical protein